MNRAVGIAFGAGIYYLCRKVKKDLMKNIMTRIWTMIAVLLFLPVIGSAMTVTNGSVSGTLPVLYVNTAGGEAVTSKEKYLKATYWLDPMGCDGIKSIGSKAQPMTTQIKGRGNYSWWGFDKKPYRLKLDSKQPLMGLDKSKHFGLLAHADDNKAFLRNPVGFKASELIGLRWTPKQKPLELVLNGEYRGLYFLTELIRVDEKRVDIVEQPDNISQLDSITGGWLVEIDNYDTDPHITVMEGDSNYPIIFTYKTPEELSAAQEQFLTQQMSAINNAIYTNDKSSTEWEKYVDIDELAKFYIVQEIVDNYESFHGSCYLYRDMGADRKWSFGPVWDFGSAFNYDKSQYIYEGREHHQVWIRELCRFPRFMNRVKELWADFYQNHLDELYAYVDSYSAQIAEAAKADRKRWPDYGAPDYASAVSLVKERLRSSAKWLVKQWGGAPKASYKVYFRDNVSPAWSKVKVWIWDKGDNNHGYSGSWPGCDMTFNAAENVWHYAFEADQALADPWILFNEGEAGAGHQTADFELKNNGLYNRNGYLSVDDIADDGGLRLTPGTGYIEAETPTVMTLTLYTITGQSIVVKLAPGINRIELPHGMYIVSGRKLLVK